MTTLQDNAVAILLALLALGLAVLGVWLIVSAEEEEE